MIITDSTYRFIDISKWQDPKRLTWGGLPADVSAVIMRATYGKTLDPHVKAHFDACVDHRRTPGLYHFVTYEDPTRQWDAFERVVELVGYGDIGDVLPVLDCEHLPGEHLPSDPARFISTTAALMARCDSVFGGCIIYTSERYWRELGKPKAWLERPLWISHYPSKDDNHESLCRTFALAGKVSTPNKLPLKIWQSGPRIMRSFATSKIDYNYASGPLPAIG